ncbi:MAG TPA: RHS repeat-associated core domain-containing protein [Bryobacteraceae bacterium]|nr:RHS repeat-associated core domain-containing protein [Bryobacteraceae bacterium]
MPIASFAGSTYVYDAFGNLAAEYGGDPTSALDFFNVRYYSGAPGRFQSPDPGNAGADPSNPQSWNGYAYVNNNPLSYTDPTGMFTCVSCYTDESGNPVLIAIGAAIDIGSLLAGIFGGGGPPPSIPSSLATPSSPIMGAVGDVDISGLKGGWWSQCGFLYGTVCGIAPASLSDLGIPLFHAEGTAKMPRDPVTIPLGMEDDESSKPSCFVNFLINWGEKMNPFPTEPNPWDLSRTAAENTAFYFKARAWQHAGSRALRYPAKSSIFRGLSKAGEAAEELAGPIYVLGTGIASYVEDLEARHEGTCRPFAWENQLP